jgi:hypothetical protein
VLAAAPETQPFRSDPDLLDHRLAVLAAAHGASPHDYRVALEVHPLLLPAALSLPPSALRALYAYRPGADPRG